MRDKLQSISKRFRRAMGWDEPPPAQFPIAYEPQAHELELIEYFSQEGRKLFTQAHQPVVPTNVVLCFTNRCGSNWLAALLNATGLIGLADEYFNAPRLIRTCDSTQTTSLTDAFKNQAQAEVEQLPGSFITKLSWDQLYFFGKTRIIPEMMPNTRFILMRRRNMAAQALSMRVAEQTGQWTSIWNSGKNGERDLSKISDMEIQHSIDEVAFKYNQFQRYFGTFGVEPVEVVYEDIIADPLAEVTRLVEALSLNPDNKPWQLDESKVKLKKQADKDSEARVAAFYENMQNHSPETPETDTEAA